jgi:hypothetical protein
MPHLQCSAEEEMPELQTCRAYGATNMTCPRHWGGNSLHNVWDLSAESEGEKHCLLRKPAP